MEFGSRLSHGAAIFCAAAITVGVLLAPVKSHAQNDQMIVMTCVYYTRHQTYTLDLARKTVVEEAYDERFPQQLARLTGTITNITEQEITWNYGGNGNDFALNRFTGDLYQTAAGHPAGAPAHCQRQQKQF